MKAKGFSLVEVLVVLILLSFMLAVAVPAVDSFMRGLSFRTAVQHIKGCLQYARLMAITKGKMVELTLDEETRTFKLSGAVTETKNCEMSEEAVIAMEPEVIFFSPEGRATPMTFSYAEGDRTARISLDPLTAIPILE